MHFIYQLSSFAQSCPTLCNPMSRSTPGLPIHHQLPESTQTHVHWVGDAIQPSHPVVPFSSCPQSFLAPESFQMSQLFASVVQSIRVSASTSVLPMNTLYIYSIVNPHKTPSSRYCYTINWYKPRNKKPADIKISFWIDKNFKDFFAFS